MQAGGAELVALLHELGPDQVVDMDLLLQRMSLDVMGRVGFNFDFGSLKVSLGPVLPTHVLPQKLECRRGSRSLCRVCLQRARLGADASVAKAYGVDGGGGDDDMLHNMSLAMLEVTKRQTNPALAAYLPGKTGAVRRRSSSSSSSTSSCPSIIGL